MTPILTGIDRFQDGYWRLLKGQRLGLLANQASLDRNLEGAAHVISRLLPGHLKALFGPQHGHGGEDQDNMVETDHSYDSELQVPIFSLYAEERTLSDSMLEGIDVLIIDLQDVGTRVYTFSSTLLNCLRAAALNGTRVLVLDRPNPLGGEIVEGHMLQEEMYSFVGPYRFPMRHGLTMGEMARVFQKVYAPESDLEILPMQGWRRDMLWNETGLRWLMPSPNMPRMEAAFAYPGQVLWEGTNISEGRGTCRPFEIFGAPFFNTKAVRRQLEPQFTQGCVLQDYMFRPTFHKWEGRKCKGFMLHITDTRAFRPYFASLGIIKAVAHTHAGDFLWKDPPYEYEYERVPFDLISGNGSVRRDIDSDADLSAMEHECRMDLNAYLGWREPYLLYR